MVPTFTEYRSTREVPSLVPAASPRLGRSPSTWPPHRHNSPASELTAQPPGGHALRTGPDLPGWSRHWAYGTFVLVPLVHLLVSLAGPAPSGSAGASRRCQGCFPPSPAPPGSDCP